MGVECASCGQVIPSGQFRCGSCGAVQPRQTFDDYGGMSELSASAGERAPSPSQELAVPRAVEPASQTGSFKVLPPQGASGGANKDASAGEEEEAPVVPRGTFASVAPETSEEDEHAREPGKPEAKAEAKPSAPKPAPASAPTPSTSQPRTKSNRPPTRPPYLASEILREDLTPSEPGRKRIDFMLHVAPALGAIAVLSSGIHRLATWVSLAVLALLFLTTRLELSYFMDATVVAALGGIALVTASTARVLLGGSLDGPMLAAAATLLPAALIFRTWYRAAYTARVLVALALVLALSWATVTSHRDLLSLEFNWESWVPALSWYVFGLLCLLSLLAFMGEETTGGCDVWALGVWVWYGLFACSRFAIEGALSGHPQEANFQTLGLVEPALAAPTSVALAQLFARTFVSRPAAAK